MPQMNALLIIKEERLLHFSRVLVEIVIPIIDANFDFYLPVGCQLIEVWPLLLTAVIDLSSGNFMPNSAAIYHLEDEMQLSLETTIDFHLNGTKLLII